MMNLFFILLFPQPTLQSEGESIDQRGRNNLNAIQLLYTFSPLLKTRRLKNGISGTHSCVLCGLKENPLGQFFCNSVAFQPLCVGQFHGHPLPPSDGLWYYSSCQRAAAAVASV